MQKTIGGGEKPGPADRGETHRTIISDLTLIVVQVRRSIALIESEIANEAVPGEEFADDIVVLDDLTPGYARARAVLQQCDAGLCAALGVLEEPVIPGEVQPVPANSPPPVSLTAST